MSTKISRWPFWKNAMSGWNESTVSATARTTGNPSTMGARSGWTVTLEKREGLVVCLFVLLLLVINIGTGVLYPTSWMDEAMFADPAINFLQNKGFTSTAWWQSKNLTWSGNVPLYTLSIIPWIKLFGIGLIKVRAFNYTVISATILVFWMAIKRLGWIQSATARIAMIVVAFLSLPFFFPYRCARPDCLGILLCAMALFLWSVPNRSVRNGLLLLVGALVPTSGLQLVCFMGLLCILCFMLEGKKAIPSLLFLCTGIFIGVISLIGFYYFNHLNGVIETIKEARRLHHMAEVAGAKVEPSFIHKALIKLKRILGEQLGDYGIMPALLALGILAFDRKVWANAKSRALIVTAFISTFGIVSALEVFLHYLPYYHWMNYSILIIILFIVMSRAWTMLGRFKQALLVLLLCGSVMGGMPLRLFLGGALEQQKEYVQFKQLIGQQITKQDVVFSDFMGFFPLKATAGEVYLPPYLRVMTDEERQSVNVLVLDPINFDGYSKIFTADGKKWVKVASLSAQPSVPGNFVRRIFPSYAKQPTSCGYSIIIMRRES